MSAEERFDRIERKHEELAELVARIAQGHIALVQGHTELVQGHIELVQGHTELEAAQLNQLKVHTRLEEVVADLGERVVNLTILVDTLIKRDLDRGAS